MHPAIVIELSLSNSNADLLRREADIAVRMSRPKQKSLLAKRTGHVALGLHAHRRYLAAAGMPRDIEDLRRHALVGFDKIPGYVSDLKGLPTPVTRELFAFRSDNELAQLNAIRGGFGIGVCQFGIARRDAEPISVLPRSFRFELETWIVMHEDQKRLRCMKLLFDDLVRGISAYAAASKAS